MFGRNLLTNNAVFPTRASFDGRPQYKAGGIQVDWTTVTALGSDTTDPDGSIVRTGQKRLRYGSIVCRITGSDNTLTETGSPTGGTYTLTVTTPAGGTATTAAIAQAAAASAVQSALVALANVGTGNVTVTGSTGGPYTVVFNQSLGTVVVALGTNSLSGGTAPSVTIGTSLATGGTSGYFGPYDSAASDGRQTLTRGECFIVDETVLQYANGISQISAVNDQVGGVFDAGTVWKDRILQAGAGTHSLAAGPTLSEFLAAFPAIQIVEN